MKTRTQARKPGSGRQRPTSAPRTAPGHSAVTAQVRQILHGPRVQAELTVGAPEITPGLEAQIHSLRGGGQPLPPSSRAFFEPRFGQDFSGVRLHTSGAAAEVAAALRAKAFTTGDQIVFGGGQYAPASQEGQRLLAHELTHVVQQQAGGPAGLVRSRSGVRLARADLDLDRLDRELRSGDPLTQSEGDIGHGAAPGPRLDPPTEDPDLRIHAEVYRKSPPLETEGEQSPSESPAPPVSPEPEPMDAGTPPEPEIRDAGEPLPGGVPEPEPGPDTSPAPPPTPTLAPPPPRALVVGGIHGNERGPLDIMAQLRSELGAGASSLRRDFDTIVIPEMNPGGIHATPPTRGNPRGVDLNRNFPGLRGQPAPSGPVPPEQPETRAVRTAIERLRPDRILALHAIENEDEGGVYADPVEGPARELACRMALRMRGVPATTGGGMTGDVNVEGNRIPSGVCESRYPGRTPELTSAQSSLGAWASAPASAGGMGTIVITHEVSEKTSLPASGTGRSVDTIMPGIREFFLDNGGAPSEADALLRQSINDAFLTGEGGSSLRSAIEGLVRSRFRDLARHYREVWLPAQPATERTHLERVAPRLTSYSHVRTFEGQRRIVVRELASRGIGSTSTVDEIEAAIRDIMQTRSMPGFSRHHWGTEIDVISATRTRWEGSGDLVHLIPFLQTEARNFGFFHPYTAGFSTPPTAGFPQPADPHYQEEPWHISYWEVADVLQEEWARRAADLTNTAFQTLIARAAHEIARRRGISDADMETALGRLNLPSFQTNVAPAPR